MTNPEPREWLSNGVRLYLWACLGWCIGLGLAVLLMPLIWRLAS